MSTVPDADELQTTKSEKLLAVVMTVFLLIGGVWAYQEIDDRVRSAVEVRSASAADRAAIERLDRRSDRLLRAEQAQSQARQELELRREAYRTALDARRPAAELERRYRRAETAYEAAVRERRAAGAAVAVAAPAAGAAERRVSASADRRRDRQALITFGLRLALVLGSLAFGLWLLARLRRRNSRYLPLGFAAVMFATILAFVLAVDYLTDYFNPFDLGLLVLSVIGVAATTAVFWLLQRYLRRRLPTRRVRKRECPFCGYPVGENPHCEGCGREVVAPCARCDRPRRVGSLHCRSCGAG